MKVSKQHKILGAVLVIGLAAVMCDRFFVLSSSPAQPASSDDYALPTAAKPAAAVPRTPALSVAERLRSAAGGASGAPARDVFSLTEIWGMGASQNTPSDPLSEQFRRSHRLTGVLSSGGKVHAMIDGQITTIGQVIDGFRLTSISNRSVVFEAQGNTVVLEMSEGGRSAVSSVQ